MKRASITIFVLIFGISFCLAQNIRDAVNQNERAKTEQQQAAEKQKRSEEEKRKAVEAKKQSDYQNAIESAQNNFNQKKYAQAKQNYITALELIPENAASINPKITEIDELIVAEEQQRAEAERERKYQVAINSAQKNLDQRQYAKAKQDYNSALEIKPENADFINSKIAELETPASLNIYRKRSLVSFLVPRYDILLDNAVVANRTVNNWKTTITVDTFGAKKLSATIDGRKVEIKIDFEPGGVYYVRGDVDSKTVKTGKTKTVTARDGTKKTEPETKIEYTPTLQLMEKSVGESDYNSIK